MDTERVYIGGFDVSCLSGDEIIQRLRSQLVESIEIQGDVHYGSCFCHLDVVSKQDGITALENISKVFNNVKWKGCKLKVEKARPHFLERLAKERMERLQTITKDDHQTDYGRAGAQLPRFLRIKRIHGQECWKVDTKPLEVSDWKRFGKLREKMLKSTQPSERSNFADGRKPKPAIHLMFGSSETSSVNSSKSKDESDDGASSSFSSSSSSAVGDAKGNYEWSDDDDDLSLLARSPTSSLSPDKLLVARLSNDSVLNHDSCTDSDSTTSRRSNEEAKTMSCESVCHEAGADLDNDTEMGLNVISELFPDFERTATPAMHNDIENLDGSQFGSAGMHPGVFMERYDPSQRSAKKYVLDCVIEGPQDTNDSAKGPVEFPVSAPEPELPENSSELNAPKDIYEEAQLEAVFREARTSNVPTSAAGERKATADSFAFGFSLDGGTNQQEPPPAPDSFVQFSFSADEYAMPAAIFHESDETANSNFRDDVATASEDVRDPKRRRAFFSEDELRPLVENFFLTGDGQKIRDDLDRYKNDNQIHERWLQERKSLTADWKRKRKYALSRRKKV